MCKIYLARDPIQYECRSRTLRVHGVVTTIRLENEFWRVLQKIAESESKTTNALITQFYDEAVMSTPEEAPSNFASVLRVTCCRYLELTHESRSHQVEESSQRCAGTRSHIAPRPGYSRFSVIRGSERSCLNSSIP
jgi:predicted DNA-binding ribbon-helix-helix protein